ncbi:MAG: class I SAM-dependent methyltransferase, partial [Dehalococcoidia bacterium]|nr:class I SAM-dependent methyltransferase [Dehalococcoidia bacterium]
MAEIDWLELWRDLATTMRERSGEWASRYESHARRKIPEKPDPLLDFVLRNLSPQSTLLDIGAGGGRWALPIARIARSVTAVEPSATMREILEQNIAAAKLDNIRIVPALWQEAGVEAHDVVISAHAMNSSPDFAGFVRKMERHA